MGRELKGLLVVVVFCAATVFGSGTASAAFYPFEGKFGSFQTPESIAVDADGDLYVLDRGARKIFKVDKTGAPVEFTELGSSEIDGSETPSGAFRWWLAWNQQVAVDRSAGPAAGALYVTDIELDGLEEPGVVDIFDSETGKLLGQLTESAGEPLRNPCGVTVDPQGRLYVADGGSQTISRYDPSGSIVTNADYDARITGVELVCDIAVNADGDVFGTTSGGGVLRRFDASQFGGTADPVQLGDAVRATAVGPDDDVYAAHPDSIEQFDQDGNSLGEFGRGRFTDARAIDVDLAENIFVADDETGEIYVWGPALAPELPQVESLGAVPARNEAKLLATIDPGNAEATYHFEYGTTDGYGRSTLPVPLPANNVGVPVSSPVFGLTPSTTYHFRVVVSNEVGTVEGPDQTFTTLPAQSGGSCPNEAFRQGPSALLGECRAYEMVSPVDKSGGGVNQKVSGTIVASGDAAAFLSTASFAGAESNSLSNLYISRRGGENWSTEALAPPQLNPSGFINQTTVGISPDFSHSLQASKIALAPGAIEGGSNVYIRNNLTGERELVAAAPGNQLFQDFVFPGAIPFVGAADDFSHIVFNTTEQLHPDAPPGVESLYDYNEGELRLVNYLPDETVPPGGAHGGTGKVANEHSVSADGRRVFFTEDNFGSGRLYVREDNTRTVAISESQRPGEEGLVVPGYFGAATADGSAVYFTSSHNLTPESDVGTTPTLYRYDVEAEELTDLLAGVPTPDSGAGVSDQLLGVGGDGAYVYFDAKAALAPGAVELSGSFSQTNIYAWHGGEIRYIATTDPGEQEFGGPGQRMVSPDGSFFAMGSNSPLTPEDVPSPACPADGGAGNAPEHCKDVYLYDFAADELTCLSCDGPGAGFSNLGGQEFTEPFPADQFPQSVLDDGTVFFDSPNKLVPADVNGRTDVYAWRDGKLTLLSPGNGPYPAVFADATDDARSVFIRTAQPLVKQDIDQSIDLYDARVNGGLAGQNPPGVPQPCEGEGCRGEPPLPPPAGSPASSLPKVGEGPARGCGRFAAAATKAMAKARGLQRHAAKAEGPKARQLRRAAKQQGKKAKRLRAKARNCGGKN